jgi:hypothetical protein
MILTGYSTENPASRSRNWLIRGDLSTRGMRDEPATRKATQEIVGNTKLILHGLAWKFNQRSRQRIHTLFPQKTHIAVTMAVLRVTGRLKAPEIDRRYEPH